MIIINKKINYYMPKFQLKYNKVNQKISNYSNTSVKINLGVAKNLETTTESRIGC